MRQVTRFVIKIMDGKAELHSSELIKTSAGGEEEESGQVKSLFKRLLLRSCVLYLSSYLFSRNLIVSSILSSSSHASNIHTNAF